ncbi:MAG: MarR family transcriptional regulator [Deinococcus sp.]|nr:MarR family transcriptional regulator [Deinococcus sp.]
MRTDLQPLTDDAILRFLGGLWQLNRRMKQDIEPLLAEHHDLDLRRYFILQGIRHGLVYPKQLAEKLDFPPTLLSRYLEQLTSSGLIERQIDRKDSRRTLLSLTEKGSGTLDNAVQAIKRNTSQRLKQLEPHRLFALLDAIEVLAEISSLQEQP